jgi:predicted metalloendopeptidase
MRHRRSVSAVAFLIAFGAQAADQTGISRADFDPAVRPQDDLYVHANGGWIARTEIPADKAIWRAGDQLTLEARLALKGILEALAAERAVSDPDARKVADLYRSFMDEGRANARGLQPIEPELARIAAIKSRSDLAEAFARFSRLGAPPPMEIDVDQDDKDSSRYVVLLHQAGLGLPDRDYYLSDDARFRGLRDKYQGHLVRVLESLHQPAAAADAAAVLALETQIAQAHWTRVENRDSQKRYNKYELKDLPSLMPSYDWPRYLAAAGIAPRADDLIVNQPSYLQKLDAIVRDTSLATWRAYFTVTLMHAYAPYLSQPVVAENFALHGTAVRGVPSNEPRWRRGVDLVDESIGEALGRLYVEKYFPPPHKARVEVLVRSLLATYRDAIESLEWMGPETKAKAQEKLAKFTYQIGYPKRWRDYTRLEVKPDDLFGNRMRAVAFEYDRQINKLGRPVDRDEWEMTPQTVNAYYKAELNQIVFPAAILRPPFFYADADDAVNYGAIGTVIGHEISHGFDDQGSQFDGDGNLRDWWTADDHARFKARTAALVAQYSVYEPLPGFHVNGELTLGENIADNSGLAIAIRAYHRSLAGREPPVLDGLTGDQRLLFGLAQAWHGKARDEERIRRIKIDPHSPEQFRVNGSVVNADAYYAAFGVHAGDRMYRPPEQRVHIW